jgi:hypothetical protein
MGREGRFWGTGGEYQRPAGGAAGLAGLRVYGATPVDLPELARILLPHAPAFEVFDPHFFESLCVYLDST